MTPTIEVEEDIIRELYETERMNSVDIASAIGVSNTTIKNRMKEYGITPRFAGRFEQTRREFSLNNFNDGYVDNNGRFRVWKPGHPRAYEEGYILRSIVAYEAYNNVDVIEGMNIHHKDGNKLNDMRENLEMMLHNDHSHVSNQKTRRYVKRICMNCKKTFEIAEYRLKERYRGTYCSENCRKTKKHNFTGERQ